MIHYVTTIGVIFLSFVAKSPWKMKFGRWLRKDRFRENYLGKCHQAMYILAHSRRLQKQIGTPVVPGQGVVATMGVGRGS